MGPRLFQKSLGWGKLRFERVECDWLCNFMQIYLCKPENEPSIHSRYLSIVLVSSTSTDSILQFKYWYGQYLDMGLFCLCFLMLALHGASGVRLTILDLPSNQEFHSDGVVYPPPESGARITHASFEWRAHGRWNIIPFGQIGSLGLVHIYRAKWMVDFYEVNVWFNTPFFKRICSKTIFFAMKACWHVKLKNLKQQVLWCIRDPVDWYIPRCSMGWEYLLGTSDRWSPYSLSSLLWVDPGILYVGPTKSLTFSRGCHDYPGFF